MQSSVAIVVALSFFIALSPFVSKTLRIPIVVVEIIFGVLGIFFCSSHQLFNVLW